MIDPTAPTDGENGNTAEAQIRAGRFAWNCCRGVERLASSVLCRAGGRSPSRDDPAAALERLKCASTRLGRLTVRPDVQPAADVSAAPAQAVSVHNPSSTIWARVVSTGAGASSADGPAAVQGERGQRQVDDETHQRCEQKSGHAGSCAEHEIGRQGGCHVRQARQPRLFSGETKTTRQGTNSAHGSVPHFSG